jgi:hypothetical protein
MDAVAAGIFEAWLASTPRDLLSLVAQGRPRRA